MVTLAAVALLLAASLAALFTAWAIGAGSSGSTPFAPAVAANAIPTMRAAFVVGVLGFLGAVLQGANVSETVGNELVRGASLSPLAATIALFTAAALIAAGVFRGYPIATAFAVSGSIVGVGLALGGDPAWPVYAEIALFWVLTPVVGGPAAYATARLLRSDPATERVAVPVLAGVVAAVGANMDFVGLGPGGEGASLAVAVAARLPVSELPAALLVTSTAAVLTERSVARAAQANLPAARRRLLLALGTLVAFSAGGGKVGLAIGPLLPLLAEFPVRVPLLAVLTFGGVGLLVGSWTGAPRMIKALSQDYSKLGPRRSIAVLVPSFAIAQAGIFLGVPMSFNEIFVSAIVGSGYAAGRGGVSRRKILYTVLAWVGSLVGAFAVGYGLYAAVSAAVTLA